MHQMICFLCLFLHLKISIKCGALPSHDKYLRSHDITCGTKLKTTSQSATARVVNGEKVSNEEYPWLAVVQNVY